MTQREGLQELERMAADLPNVAYDDIKAVMRESIRRIPLPLAIVHANSSIDRARKNDGNNLFTDVHNQLSYIRDANVLAQLSEFGRANQPHQALFYGSINSTAIPTARITALAETSSLMQDPTSVCLQGELYTISRWTNPQNLTVVEMVFARDAIAINPDISRAFNNQRQFVAQHGVDVGFYTDLLIFVSEQFARRRNTHHDYKISAAYTELAFQHPDVQGIAFPSVQTHYRGQNLVFPPNIVDQHLQVSVLSVQRLHKNGALFYLNNHKNCENPQQCLNNIQWMDLPPEHIAPDQYIQQYLAGLIH